MTSAHESLPRALGTKGEQAAKSAHFQALVESSEDAILSKDTEGVITSWNPAAERLYGYTPEEAVGQRIAMIIPEDRINEEGEILGRILAGEHLAHYETDRVTKDGRRVEVSLTISPIRDGDEAIVGASVVARDVTGRALARRRAEHLQRITSALARETEPKRAIRVLLTAGVEALGADAASTGLVDRTGALVELADSVGHSEDGLSGWRSFPLEADLPMCVAIRELKGIWSSSPEDVVERFPLLAAAEFRFAALVVLPLAVEGRAIGAVSFSFAEAKQFTAEERAFIAAIVQQAAYNVERGRIYEAERRARQQLSFLAVASRALSESLDTRRTLEQLAEVSVTHLSDWCAVDLVGDDGVLESVAILHVDRSKVELARELRRRYPPDPASETGAPAVVRTGQAQLYAEVPEELLEQTAQDPEHLAMIREIGIVSAMVVPLTARGRTVGAITFAASDPGRAFDADDLELAEDLGRRAGLAIDTSTLYRREHEAALTLQRALLPPSLPEVEGLTVAARYLPAEAGLEVGGDWYDVVDTGDGQVQLVIGDVGGRGVRAAAVMGRLAIALRAYAIDGLPVNAVVGGVNRLMCELKEEEIATVFALSLNPKTGEATYARAGHPPALVRMPDGTVVELSGEGAPPIGWREELPIAVNSASVPPGSTILLYTDGLIERREYDIHVAIERLKSAFASGPAEPAEIVESLPAQFGAERVQDDIALLAARIG
jgi:PAS domain S-box-containing protein